MTNWELDSWGHFSELGIMMMSWNGNTFHITGLLWGETTGHQWIPFTRAPWTSDVSLMSARTNCWTSWWCGTSWGPCDVTVMIKEQKINQSCYLYIPPTCLFYKVSEWVIRFNSLSGDSGQRGPYSPYTPCNHSLYTGIIIFPNIDNPQSTGHN